MSPRTVSPAPGTSPPFIPRRRSRSKYLVAPFRGELSDVEAKLADGRLTGAVKVASIAVKDENLAPTSRRRTSSTPSSIREITFSSDTLDDRRRRLTLDGELTIKGVTQPVTRDRQDQRPDRGLHGQHPPGPHLEADDRPHRLRRRAGTPPLPKGGNALGNDVTLAVELEFVKA